MSAPVISVENLSKSYRLGQIGTGTFSNDLKVWWAKKRGKPNPLLKIGQSDHGNRDGETLWALKDVSFTVQQGEVLGIIGRNGAGKSTLLKILSRVTAPTSGQVKVKGRIASLLEVGTGFHPELTGRENIYLNGAILGMSKEEVRRKFDEIVAFAEVAKFIDTPVKRYSSGMYVRLAFAVAAHLEPEILVVDEVLAVGDAEFQKKCLGKMGDVAKEGRTVLFVSHNMGAIRNLCQRSILLAKGELVNSGPTPEIVEKYLYTKTAECAEQVWENINTAPGNNVVKLHAVRIMSNDKLATSIPSDCEVVFETEYWNRINGCRLIVEVRLLDPDTGYILNTFSTPEASLTQDELITGPLETGLYRSRLVFPPNFFNEKHFSIHLIIIRQNPTTAEINLPDIISFSILDSPKLRTPGLGGKWSGSIRTLFKWSSTLIQKVEL